MAQIANFSVDPRLASILGESYSSSERALRELVDNAWDAEARVVQITLPAILTETPIIIADDGSGMKEQELRQEYLNIASPRYTRKGEKTPNLLRTVKGRRGIGKFAGLILAEQMEVDTKACGTRTRLVISKSALLNAEKDIEQVPLPLEAKACKTKEHGTTITLKTLNQNLNFPKAEKLKEILAYDYGRETDFEIFINGERVLRHDIQGATFTREYTLPNGTKATATYTISEKPVPNRPDLLLAANVESHHLLVEFKRPSIAVGRDAEAQAKKYADTLTGELGIDLDILILGGEVDSKLHHEYTGKRTRFLAYRSVIANARTQLDWLLNQLKQRP